MLSYTCLNGSTGLLQSSVGCQFHLMCWMINDIRPQLLTIAADTACGTADWSQAAFFIFILVCVYYIMYIFVCIYYICIHPYIYAHIFCDYLLPEFLWPAVTQAAQPAANCAFVIAICSPLLLRLVATQPPSKLLQLSIIFVLLGGGMHCAGEPLVLRARHRNLMMHSSYITFPCYNNIQYVLLPISCAQSYLCSPNRTISARLPQPGPQ